jgi:hypothetical protein
MDRTPDVFVNRQSSIALLVPTFGVKEAKFAMGVRSSEVAFIQPKGSRFPHQTIQCGFRASGKQPCSVKWDSVFREPARAPYGSRCSILEKGVKSSATYNSFKAFQRSRRVHTPSPRNFLRRKQQQPNITALLNVFNSAKTHTYMS